VKQGLLDGKYEPAVMKGWDALVARCPNGMLGWVQQIGAEPARPG
jgi:hypothetical protein